MKYPILEKITRNIILPKKKKYKPFYVVTFEENQKIYYNLVSAKKAINKYKEFKNKPNDLPF